MTVVLDLVARVDALLPQTQCQRCGYLGCRPYAAALARGDAAIDRCPPGGQRTVAALAALLGCPERALDRSRGEPTRWLRAEIDEAACIGCTLCIQACPVDAIVGAARRMHTVVQAECTGCELCLAPCPVDCIGLVPMAVAVRGTATSAAHPALERGDGMTGPAGERDGDGYGAVGARDPRFLDLWMTGHAGRARARHEARAARVEAGAGAVRRRAGDAGSERIEPALGASVDVRRAEIAAAVARVRGRRPGDGGGGDGTTGGRATTAPAFPARQPTGCADRQPPRRSERGDGE